MAELLIFLIGLLCFIAAWKKWWCPDDSAKRVFIMIVAVVIMLFSGLIPIFLTITATAIPQ